MKKLLLSLMIAATCFSGEMTWGKDNSATVSAYKNDFPEYIKFYAKYCIGIVDGAILALENMKKNDKDSKKTIEGDIKTLKAYKKALESIHDRKKESDITSSINKCPKGSLAILSRDLTAHQKTYYIEMLIKIFGSIPGILFNANGASALGQATYQFFINFKALVSSN